MQIGDRRFVWDYRKIVKIALITIAVAVVVYFAYTLTRPTLLQFFVLDASTGQVLPDTMIEVQNDNGQTIVSLITDERGWAGVKRLLPGGGYRALARHVDYVQAERRGIEVRLHRTVSIRLPLRPRPGGRLYLAARGGYLGIIDTASFLSVGLKKVSDRLSSLPISDLALHPQQPWLYVAAGQSAYRLDATTLELQGESRLGGNILKLQWSADGQQVKAFVGGRGTRLVTLDASTGDVQASVQTPDVSASASIFFLPDDEAYVVDGENAYVGILDTVTGRLLRRLSVPFRPGWSVASADGQWLYMGDSRSEQLIKLDVRARRLVELMQIGSGWTSIALNSVAQQLYLANASLGLLLVMDAETLSTLATLPVGRQPVAIVADGAGERVYVANAESRTISVLDVKSRQIIETVALELAPLKLAIR